MKFHAKMVEGVHAAAARCCTCIARRKSEQGKFFWMGISAKTPDKCLWEEREEWLWREKRERGRGARGDIAQPQMEEKMLLA